MMDFEKYNNEPEFKAALKDMFESLDDSILNNKEYIEHDIFNRIITPDNIITFDVKWLDDNNIEHINKGYRVQFNNANGPYKGGLRFHPTVNLSILKFLGFEQIFKNVLTGLPMGGGKGGSDFNPKGKSNNEIKRFCYAFMKELYPYIGVNKDVPAGDIGVGGREIENMYLAYKELSGKSDCSLTGKPLYLGGSLCRTEATGFGVTYFASYALKEYLNETLKGKRVIVSGSGNVALYCLKKVSELGGKVIAMSDSNNVIYNENGIDFNKMKEIKEINRERIAKYKEYDNTTIIYDNPHDIWGIKCDVAFPCATQFELNEDDAHKLINNKVLGVFEGANMPCTLEAQKLFIDNKIIYSPGKASNAGGVAVSGLEIIQNVNNEKWTFEEVDKRLDDIMHNIFNNIYQQAKELNAPYDLVKGANNFAFNKVARLMIARDK